ncbi:alpha/beta fold hydrolase [Streptomyces clavuligerus]|uniref:Esterase n=1 Tax=Streptomyces clavuligerus TaxID=1901 RepID=D5SJT5_STRCL|nr:alpha/beta hydrolase [Streptomyces clavuligerus]EFG04178.1 esterase [Streptomyces clavuligerus]MBY6307341.1 alpha/beta fold hydrolase [Streptomyces clavuligerus]QCS10091.1 alpha/beta hydrolase [Streptomyces clavuligerus]QPJ97864.1 alpha/beta fold hydrolase [Streptomyces clavuligerus]WDN56799.1 alpha/beta hydrolase [Streptomyces clavuligerus]
MAVFVLVPGAWLGAWAWEDTARALRERGHTALPLTLTGLAERAAEATPRTGLDTHVADIADFVEQHDLHEVTLVAHSYAAAPVTAVAGRIGGRLRRVVYVDSAPFAEGMCLLDLMSPQEAEPLHRLVTESGGVRWLPLPSFAVLADSTSLDGLDDALRRTLRERATPQPFASYEQRLTGVVEPGPDVDRVVVACGDFTTLLDAGVPMLDFLGKPPWRRFDVPTGHWPMLSEPAALAAVLDEAVS